LSYACLLSTKGAYYVVNKQASISKHLSLACLAIARDRRQDKSQFCPFRANKQGKQASVRDRRQDKKAV
jgi:hypothetical protein